VPSSKAAVRTTLARCCVGQAEEATVIPQNLLPHPVGRLGFVVEPVARPLTNGTGSEPSRPQPGVQIRV
jgi:hypothetical protein